MTRDSQAFAFVILLLSENHESWVNPSYFHWKHRQCILFDTKVYPFRHSVSFSTQSSEKELFSLCSHVHPLQGTLTNKPARFVHTLRGSCSTIPSYNTPSIVFNRLNLLKLYNVRRFRGGVITSSAIFACSGWSRMWVSTAACLFAYKFISFSSTCLCFTNWRVNLFMSVIQT